MTDEQKAAFINAQAACAVAEIASMQAENNWCMLNGTRPTYTEVDFNAIQGKYMIGHNAVIGFFRGN